MAKKKRNTVVNNIDTVNVEIDYDKLAQAIVKANKLVGNKDVSDEEKDPQKKLNLFKAIVQILKGDQDKNGRLLSNSFVLLLTLFFKTMAVAGFLFSLVTIGIYVYYLTEASWSAFSSIVSNIFLLIPVFSVSYCIFLYSVLMWGAGNDIKKEKDKNYIISVFSGITGLAALIVSFIALMKGVG